jgi:hypothetical protein
VLFKPWSISSPRHCALTLLPLDTAITLSHPLRGYILAQCSIISHRSSTTINMTLIEQPHYNHSQDQVCSLVTALLLSKLLQHKTDRYVFPGSFPDDHGLMIFVQSLYVAPRPEGKGNQQQGQSQDQSQTSTSQIPPAAVSTSPTLLVASIITSGAAGTQSGMHGVVVPPPAYLCKPEKMRETIRVQPLPLPQKSF